MTRCTAIVALLLWGWPAAGDAQTDVRTGVAGSFEQLQVLVNPGSTVTLTDAAGSQVSGRVDSLTRSVLSLELNGARRDFNEADVMTIRQRRGDSLANGAWWGFGAGAVIAALAIGSCVECFLDEPGWMVAAASLYGAMGAGFGVGVDALIRREQTIYRRPGLNVSLRF